jgi:hypothetical protein
LESTFGPARSLWCSIGLRACRELPSRLLLDRPWRSIFAGYGCGSRLARFRPSGTCCGARCRLCGAGCLLSVRAARCGFLGRFCAFCELEISILVVVHCILALAFSPTILACLLQPFRKNVHSYLFRVFSSLHHSPLRHQRFASHPPSSSCSAAAPPPPDPLHSSAHSVAWEPPVPRRSSQLL